MQPIVFISAVSRLLPSQSYAENAFDSARIEQQLRSDKTHERGRALGTIGVSLKTADMSEIVRLIAISLQNTDDHRLVERSINTIYKLVEARTLNPNCGADPHSPIDQVIKSFRHWWRGLQMKRIRQTLESSADLRNSLVELIRHKDSKIRRKVVASLYLTNSPSRDFEWFMHQRYQAERDVKVRVSIVSGLTMHKYTSDVTINVYRHALEDPSVEVRRAALRGIDALDEPPKVANENLADSTCSAYTTHRDGTAAAK